MARAFDAAAYAFRREFLIPNKDLLRWFPGHMATGMSQMQEKLKMVDCIIEVHDARIPISGRNPRFRDTISKLKPHILVLNKADLADPYYRPSVLKHFENEGTAVVYTNCKDHRCKGVTELMPLMQKMIKKSERYNRSDERDFCGMIIGVPNVGKSSLINVLRNRYLRKGQGSAVGGVAGITRSVLNRIKINLDPLFYMLDTPGILEPLVRDIEMGLKLALCASLQDHLVGETVIADYLLYWLNKHAKFHYVKYMGLEEPSDDIMKVLTVGAYKLNKFMVRRNIADRTNKRLPDVVSAATHMIRGFRTGELGKLFLDRAEMRHIILGDPTFSIVREDTVKLPQRPKRPKPNIESEIPTLEMTTSEIK